MQIAVTDAGGLDLDEHFARARAHRARPASTDSGWPCSHKMAAWIRMDSVGARLYCRAMGKSNRSLEVFSSLRARDLRAWSARECRQSTRTSRPRKRRRRPITRSCSRPSARPNRPAPARDVEATPQRRAAQPPAPPAEGELARRADEGVRQPLLRRDDGVLGVGGHHVAGHHRHRHDVRLLGRRRSGRRAEEGRPRSRRRSST